MERVKVVIADVTLSFRAVRVKLPDERVSSIDLHGSDLSPHGLPVVDTAAALAKHPGRLHLTGLSNRVHRDLVKDQLSKPPAPAA